MTNYSELLTRGFQIIRKTLVPYVVSELKVQYQDDWWNKGVYAIIYDDHKADYPEKGTDEEVIPKIDVLLVLKTIDQNWWYFKKKLPREYKSWINELLPVRNKWAHETEEFTDAQAARALETMSFLCQSIDAEAEADLQALCRIARYGDESGSRSKEPKKIVVKVKKPVISVANGGQLKSWRDVIFPHSDVSEGRYKKAEFAADLSQVINGKAAYEYRDPVEFFGRTYITAGMENLLVQALQRITGHDGEPVVQLKTAFGGGKTHTMLALYHLFGGRVTTESVPVLKRIIDKAGLAGIPKANIAVLVGTALNKSGTKRPADMPGITINTLWGEMAYQLAKSSGNHALYDIIKEADKKGVNPGSDALTELFDKSGPTLILLDELVAYGRELYGKTDLPAGTYASFISFIQSLTEAASGSERCMVVASIPESEIEVGGEIGQKVLDTLSHHFARKEAVWKPVESNEGFEVVRRRLFTECRDKEARDAVCEAFFKMYKDNPEEFPVDCRQEEYLERMKQCYPIHPEVFDRLYNDWATLEKFQRTRGVLRLMASVINNLWESGNADFLIMPSSIPVAAPFVREELIRYLNDSWNAIVDSEVDGKKSVPVKEDSKNTNFGQYNAANKVARTLFFGSAPSTGLNNKGLSRSQVMLGCADPDDKIFIYSDALDKLANSLSYLYSGYGRYWFDTRPTLRKMMEEKASRVSDAEADDVIRNFVRQTPRGNIFKTIHICPAQSLDIPDEQSTRLVIIDHQYAYTSEDGGNAIINQVINDILTTRGAGPRIYKNTLLFCFADRKLINGLKEEVKRYIAWKDIDRDKDDLELNNADKRTISENLQSGKANIINKINAAYCWVSEPHVDPNAPKDIELRIEQLSGSEGIVSRCEATFLQNESLIKNYAPTRLSMALSLYIWKTMDCIQIKELWKYYTSYCYMDKLLDYSVLDNAVVRGLQDKAYFAIANGIDPDGNYVNLRYDADFLTLDPSAFLVKKDVADRILVTKKEVEQKEDNPVTDDVPASPFNPPTQVGPFTPPGGGTPPATPKTDYKSFYLSTEVDLFRFSRDMQKIYDEVLDKLQAIPNAKLKVSLEVEADFRSGTVDVNTKRSVEENCRALGLGDFGFNE